MRLIDSLRALEELSVPVFTTTDAAAHLNMTRQHGSQVLGRLLKAKRVIRLKRGLWVIAGRLTPEELPKYLLNPLPCYLSLHTALYYHGMIDQIPSVIYVVSLARTQRIETDLGTISVHHVGPAFFFGFEPSQQAGVMIATPEKALIDVLYLSPARSGLFEKLPELQLPASFSMQKARQMAKKIPYLHRRKLVLNRLETLLCRTDE